MNTKPLSALCARRMQREYTRTRKDIVRQLKKKQSPNDVKTIINEAISLLNKRLFHLIVLYTGKSFTQGTKDAEMEVTGSLAAAAPKAAMSFDLSSVKDPKLARITRSNIGSIGKYNNTLSKTLIKQYDTLLSDSKLLASLDKHGWTPGLGETLKKRGIDPKVISLVKDQKTTAKMLAVIREQGIRGGLHPNQVGKRLEKYVNRYFGPGGVVIDNVGKTVKRIKVDADGNYKWVNHKVTRKYKATTRTYSQLVAQNSMKQAHQDAYYDSLQKTGLVDHYISVSVLDARTCGICATMHGRKVSKGAGPQYHSRCHCDLRPVWREDSLLGDKNRPESYYQKQRDRHFLAADDLKRFNETMPRGAKLKFYSLLPEGNRTHVMPGPLKMRAIRNRLLGMPPEIGPRAPKHGPAPPSTPLERIDPWSMSDDTWKLESDKLYAKSIKDGNEHLKLFNNITKEFIGTKNAVKFERPNHNYYSLHTHPNWDSPLSPGDFVSMLASPHEKCSGATTKRAIYIIRKTPKTRSMTFQKEVAKFKESWESKRNGVIKDMMKKTGKIPDMTDVALEIGKIMAKKHGLEYKVILRKP